MAKVLLAVPELKARPPGVVDDEDVAEVEAGLYNGQQTKLIRLSFICVLLFVYFFKVTRDKSVGDIAQ